MVQILGNSSHRSHPEHACTCCKDRKYAKKRPEQKLVHNIL
jgi:hypothetical protein